ncbi:uncharacterized protein SETTUDRAFT_168900 [Exserohilum turcica Et28A]|uniref:Uncharacterized protein n=1 Tax=Exserohilum turcicum (strain 28A) TaxID=671987 RepID=R0ISE6_EXST2|nr:uncharacterized protein SETTUDRAFT_168900 [Exserohilum turcica Et28A]EOA87765.1 hypothetical protein SETTUDRAFT_168900 [Exserohilum turcica Et28A]
MAELISHPAKEGGKSYPNRALDLRLIESYSGLLQYYLVGLYSSLCSIQSVDGLLTLLIDQHLEIGVAGLRYRSKTIRPQGLIKRWCGDSWIRSCWIVQPLPKP